MFGGQDPRSQAVGQVHVQVVAPLPPEDVARARAVDVHKTRFLEPKWPLRWLDPLDGVWLGRPADAVDVGPDIDRVEAKLNEVVQAVPIDVVQAKAPAVRIGVFR